MFSKYLKRDKVATWPKAFKTLGLIFVILGIFVGSILLFCTTGTLNDGIPNTYEIASIALFSTATVGFIFWIIGAIAEWVKVSKINKLKKLKNIEEIDALFSRALGKEKSDLNTPDHLK